MCLLRTVGRPHSPVYQKDIVLEGPFPNSCDKETLSIPPQPSLRTHFWHQCSSMSSFQDRELKAGLTTKLFLEEYG